MHNLQYQRLPVSQCLCVRNILHNSMFDTKFVYLCVTILNNKYLSAPRVRLCISCLVMQDGLLRLGLHSIACFIWLRPETASCLLFVLPIIFFPAINSIKSDILRHSTVHASVFYAYYVQLSSCSPSPTFIYSFSATVNVTRHNHVRHSHVPQILHANQIPHFRILYHFSNLGPAT